jgi:hypothetical protein
LHADKYPFLRRQVGEGQGKEGLKCTLKARKGRVRRRAVGNGDLHIKGRRRKV